MANEDRSMETTVSSPSSSFSNVMESTSPSQNCMSLEDYDDITTQDTQDSYWEYLPSEILTHIFSYLDLIDKVNVEKTCQSWKECCDVPPLWSQMTFYFNSIDSIEVITKAYNLIENKGHYLRALIIKIGLPSLTQAWLMSQCIQHLLEYIAHHSSSENIEHFSLKNLNVAKEWRFFTISRNNILRAINDFLSRQKNLKSIDLTACRLTAPDGIRILRTLKYSNCRYTVQRIELHDFFRNNYTAIHGSRFSIILYSSLMALKEIGVDARHLDDRTLRRLTEKSVCRRELQHLKIFFQADKVPRSFISKECWVNAREACPQLHVSIYVCGWMAQKNSTKLWADTMPLSQCVILWAPLNKLKRDPWDHLAFLIHDLGERYSGVLESFELNSRTKATREVDTAILFLIRRCRYLTNLRIVMDSTLIDNKHSITNIISQKPLKVNVSVGRRNVRRGTR